MSIETMGRSRLQRTKPGLDYRVAVVWARPPPSSVSAQAAACPTPQSPLPGTAAPVHGGSDGRIRQGPGRVSQSATRDLRPATSSRGQRGAGALQDVVRCPHRSRKTIPERREPHRKEGTSAAGSVWLGSGLGHASVNNAGSTGSSVGPPPLPGSPGPTGMGSAGTTPVPSQSNNAWQPYRRRRTAGMHQPTGRIGGRELIRVENA